MSRDLTHLQAQVLGSVVESGPCDVFAVDYNILCGVDKARRALGALEQRGLVGRDYTSRSYRGRFGYVATRKGAEEAERIFGSEEEAS